MDDARERLGELVRLCPECGRAAHPPQPCLDLAAVRADFPFPSAIREQRGGRFLRVLSSRLAPWQANALSALYSAAGACAVAAHGTPGSWVTLAFGFAVAVATATAPRSLVVEASPGRLRLSGRRDYGAPESFAASEIERLEVVTATGCFKIMAHDDVGERHLLVTGLKGKRASEALARAIEHVIRQEPFRGERPVELAGATGATLEVKLGRFPVSFHLRADRESLWVRSPPRRRFLLDSDHIADLEVRQVLAARLVGPWYRLRVRTRRGEHRVLALWNDPAPLMAFAASARELWGLDREARRS